MNELEIVQNEAQKRYEITVGDQVAYLEYMPAGQNVVLSHTEVPEVLEGQGIGGQLVKHVLRSIRLIFNPTARSKL